LSLPFTIEEIKQIIFSCDASKASEPDEFSVFLSVSLRHYLSEFYENSSFFYDNFIDLQRINLASICLIPKRQDANLVTQYRPISLINYSVKIITKTLTKRLVPLMDTLIAHTQTSYIKGIYILDNVVYAHEALHTISKKNIKCFLFKINLETVFDKVN
jgi:Reverse transcriptase (RNA-dependent DNA polymerase)